MAKAKHPYSVHPAVGMSKKWAATLEKRTGRSLKEWVALVRKSGPAEEKDRRKWLLEKHGVPRHSAWWIAERAAGRATIMDEESAYLADAVRSVEEQYAGAKAGLRPLYDRLLAMGLALGKDVKVCPCKTMVPFYRKHVFAEVHAATKDRVDLHLALGAAKPSGRLERLRSPSGERVGHRISIESPEGIDAEVGRWLRAAYEAGGGMMKRSAPSKVPAELAAALAKNAKARATFASLAPGQRGDWLRFVDEAKKAETRAKRVARAMERLAAGKKSTY